MKYLFGIIIIFLFFAGIWYATSNTKMPEGESARTDVMHAEDISIVTSFYPLEFALTRIVGDVGTVTNIGAGSDPHNFEPTTKDMVAMQRADVVVLQGAEFEPWSDSTIDRLEADGVPVIIATDTIELHEGGHNHEDEGHEEAETEHENEHEEEVHEDEHHHGAYDPHTWLDPILFSQTVTYLTERISVIDPGNAATYQENAAILQSELAALNNEYENRLADCALTEVITSHDAFGYLAERYHFEVHSIAGLSTQDTPSVTTMAELKEEAAEGIDAILLEENSVAAYGETLARETGLQTLTINPIAYIVPTGHNYLTLMRSNLTAFATALQCHD
ncbi:zinc ABC transporter substrate-binding protein [Candidatus Kaiserbacteria bacterium]|nr:zinc ABC transporter substrate-binding protein [Candidatus Kaiserbacteria bacterium]USN88472.1 MAG: zinc ABC transporter substrate-binding protein [Candidatus Nomurabacteria bacterium]